MRQGKLEKAEQLYLRALAGYEEALGSEYKMSLHTRYCLAIVYWKQCMWEDAVKQLELVVSGFTEIMGPEHCETVYVLDFLKHCQYQLRGSPEDDSDEAFEDSLQEDARLLTDRSVSRRGDSRRSESGWGRRVGFKNTSQVPDEESQVGEGGSGSRRRESGWSSEESGSSSGESDSRRREGFGSNLWKGKKMKRVRKASRSLWRNHESTNGIKRNHATFQMKKLTWLAAGQKDITTPLLGQILPPKSQNRSLKRRPQSPNPNATTLAICAAYWEEMVNLRPRVKRFRLGQRSTRTPTQDPSEWHCDRPDFAHFPAGFAERGPSCSVHGDPKYIETRAPAIYHVYGWTGNGLGGEIFPETRIDWVRRRPGFDSSILHSRQATLEQHSPEP